MESYAQVVVISRCEDVCKDDRQVRTRARTSTRIRICMHLTYTPVDLYIYIYIHMQMGSCQNHGAFLDPQCNTAPSI